MLKSYKIALCLILTFAFKNVSIGAFLDEEAKKDILDGMIKLVKQANQSENRNRNTTMYKAFIVDLQMQDVNTLPCTKIAQEILPLLEQNVDYQKAFQIAREAVGEDNEEAQWIEFRKIAAKILADIIKSRIERSNCRDPKQLVTSLFEQASSDVLSGTDLIIEAVKLSQIESALILQATQILLCKIRQVVRENKTIN